MEDTAGLRIQLLSVAGIVEQWGVAGMQGKERDSLIVWKQLMVRQTLGKVSNP